jgi:hypothetical protein
VVERDLVKEFVNSELEELGLEIPEDVSDAELIEAFCQYVEDDCYQWLKDNLKSFFRHGEPDWESIRERARA